MRSLLLTFLLLLSPSLLWGQSVKLPIEVKAEPGMIIIAAETDCTTIEWYAPDGGLQVIPSTLLKDTKTAVCFAMKAGRFRLVAIGAKADKPAYAVTIVVVGNAPPTPIPPTPGPDPPVPPTPGPAPIPAPGLRVLIIEEGKERGKLTPGQFAAIFNQPFRDLLRAKCVRDAENPNGAFRIWDKDVDASADSKLWQDAMKRPRASVPWIIISNQDKGGGFEGKLPDKIEDTIALINQFSGAGKGGK